MSSPKVWNPLPSFSINPKLTFFGLDKSKSHCFTIPKATYPAYISHFRLSSEQLQTQIKFDINGILYPAEIRLAIIDRSRPYKLSKRDLPKTQKILFQWKNYGETQKVISDYTDGAFKDAKTGFPNPNFMLNFSHLSGEIFNVRISKNEPKLPISEMQERQLNIPNKPKKLVIKSDDIRTFISGLSSELGTDNITRLKGQRSVYIINNNVALYLKISRKVEFWGISEKVKKQLSDTNYQVFMGLIHRDIERTFIIPFNELNDYLESGNVAKDGSFKLTGASDNFISIGGCPVKFDGNYYLNNYEQLIQ